MSSNHILFSLPFAFLPLISPEVTGDDDFVSEDSSDHEATVLALQRELEQRKQEVKRLKLEQRVRQKEQLKAKELTISQQLHVMMSCIYIHICGCNCLSYIYTVHMLADAGVSFTTRKDNVQCPSAGTLAPMIESQPG